VTQENQAVLDDAAILARVKEIDPIVREQAAEAGRERRLTTAVVDALRWCGGFRMAMPAAWGGPETDICKHLTGGSTKAQFTGERQRTGRGFGLGVARSPHSRPRRRPTSARNHTCRSRSLAKASTITFATGCCCGA
jgi:hypothetical protein